MSWDTDTQYTDHELTGIEPGNGGWWLDMNGVRLFCPRDQCDVPPAVGQTARLYGKGFGFPVRGIVIEALVHKYPAEDVERGSVIERRVYKYLTEDEDRQRHADWVAGEARKKREQLDLERPERDARRLALPLVFQERLAEYERRNPDWRAEYEPYELSVVEDAVRIAKHFGSDFAGLELFQEEPWAQQSELIPGLFGGHSGNSWAAAVGLAGRYMRDPSYVKGAHGALCALVGCAAYGCPGADVPRKGE